MQRKDTVRNVESTGKFCWNLATWDLREAVNISAEQVGYAVDEFERAGLYGKLDVKKTQPIARCGYFQYAVIRDTFDMVIPGMDDATHAGLEGNSGIHKEIREGKLGQNGLK
ncbi:hypothetical protein K4K48_011853 [Colletotrichum sp. SAR 10_66]|nr:hypothetical protein K4K48_011853 [Colletotrichum sp. SAR 10_66]